MSRLFFLRECECVVALTRSNEEGKVFWDGGDKGDSWKAQSTSLGEARMCQEITLRGIGF